MKAYKKLKIWRKADQLVKSIYKVTVNFPKYELYGLTSQLRRAVLSVPLNVVEGHARSGDKEFVRFLNISLGSLAEVEYLLELSLELGYLTQSDYMKVENLREECGKMIWTFKKTIEKKG